MDKEVHFFDKQYRKGSKYYLERFRTSSDCQKKGIFKKGNNVTGVDATPGYIGKPKSLVMMKKMIPECIHKDLRFILVLREPLSRDLSWFNHLRQRNEPKSQKKENQKQYERYLERNIKSYPSTSDKNILYRGRYVEQLEQFWRLFPRNQTLVFSYETLVDHYADSLRRVAEFLKIDEGPLLKGENEEQNAREFGGKLSVSDLPKELCEQGRKFFEESNSELYALMAQPGSPSLQPPFRRFPDPCAPRNQTHQRPSALLAVPPRRRQAEEGCTSVRRIGLQEECTGQHCGCCAEGLVCQEQDDKQGECSRL